MMEPETQERHRMIKGIERVLVLAPHTDDGEFGCGGSIVKFLEAKKEVFYVAFSTAEESVPPGFPKDVLVTEVKGATRRLGIPEDNLIIYRNAQVSREALVVLEGWLSPSHFCLKGNNVV